MNANAMKSNRFQKSKSTHLARRLQTQDDSWLGPWWWPLVAHLRRMAIDLTIAFGILVLFAYLDEAIFEMTMAAHAIAFTAVLFYFGWAFREARRLHHHGLEIEEQA